MAKNQGTRIKIQVGTSENTVPFWKKWFRRDKVVNREPKIGKLPKQTSKQKNKEYTYGTQKKGTKNP